MPCICYIHVHAIAVTISVFACADMYALTNNTNVPLFCETQCNANFV